jgi:hypothetical protein
VCSIFSLIVSISFILAISEIEVALKIKILLQILQTIAGNPFCERLVEPEIVPPDHGHIIAEPVMCQFVRNHKTRFIQILLCGFLGDEAPLVKFYDSWIFHSKPSKLSNKDLVIFAERIRSIEFLGIKFHAFYRHVEK